MLFRSSGSLTNNGLAIYQLSRTTTESFGGWTDVVYASREHTTYPPQLVIEYSGGGPAPLAISTSSLTAATVNAAYSATLAATGGTAPYSWSVLGTGDALPTGLSLNATTGVISGTPAAGTAGTRTINFQVQDNDSDTATRSLTLVINPDPNVLQVTTSSLPAGMVGVAYSTTVAATNGSTPYVWSATGLPAGLSINASTGVISGTPTTAGAPTVAITVTDNVSDVDTVNLTLTIHAALTISTASLPSGEVGTAYSTTIAATGGFTPYTWSATGLPAGLSINSSTGVISGTPTTDGTSTVTVVVTDNNTHTDSETFSLIIAEPITFTLSLEAISNPTSGSVFSQQLVCSGGTAPYTWTATGLPAGLSLSTGGLLTGTATTAGNYAVQFVVEDNTGATGTSTVMITVMAPKKKSSSDSCRQAPVRTARTVSVFASLLLAVGALALRRSQAG